MNKLIQKKLPQKYSRAKRGFTLVEILIVLALIGIVAGLAMQNLGGIFGGGKSRLRKPGLTAQGQLTLIVT